MHILLLFVDGFGLGPDLPDSNPLLVAPMRSLQRLFGTIPTRSQGALRAGQAALVHTDATLGVDGLPQSGTGQTTIFTGINAAEAIGQHLGPYPNATLREIIAAGNIFHHVRGLGLEAELGNAYPPIFFERLAKDKARRTAIMQAALSAGVRLRDMHDLAGGHAVSGFSVSNKAWVDHGASVPLITDRQAGRNLMRLAQENDFTAFEYFLTDAAGHKNDHAWILQVLRELDEFVQGILDEMDLSRTLFILTSDHGNIEDWTAKGHNRNPVGTVLVGARIDEIAPRIHSLTDITPAILTLLKSDHGEGSGAHDS